MIITEILLIRLNFQNIRVNCDLLSSVRALEEPVLLQESQAPNCALASDEIKKS